MKCRKAKKKMHSISEFTMAVIVCIKLAQHEASYNPFMDSGWTHDILPSGKDLPLIDGFGWKRRNCISETQSLRNSFCSINHPPQMLILSGLSGF